MRRSGRAWKELVAEFGAFCLLAQWWQEQLKVACNESCMLVGILGTTYAQAAF